MTFVLTEIKTILEGVGSLTFDSPSEEDPWYKLKPTRILGAYYMEFSAQTELPRVLKDFKK